MLKPFPEPILLTKPLLPDIGKVEDELKEIWANGWVTNHGVKHNLLEGKLKDCLQVRNASLFNNGTIALMVALKALGITEGEVITTPFTFPATTNAIIWNGLKPVFCDIKEEYMVIDEAKLESLITEKTRAILAVHVYGFPCNVKKIKQIAGKHNLKVIYDAAHAFTSKINGESIANFGDISMFSFHGTKLFNTIEGGCLTYNNSNLKDKIHYLRNFGIKNEEEIVEIGINGKMNEVQAAIGLLNLELFEQEKSGRRKIHETYTSKLKTINGIDVVDLPSEVSSHSYQYFVIKVDTEKFGASRDVLYAKLKEYNVYTRKYFYPLCSSYLNEGNKYDLSVLPLAHKVKDRVLCLPFYSELGLDKAELICELIEKIRNEIIA